MFSEEGREVHGQQTDDVTMGLENIVGCLNDVFSEERPRNLVGPKWPIAAVPLANGIGCVWISGVIAIFIQQSLTTFLPLFMPLIVCRPCSSRRRQTKRTRQEQPCKNRRHRFADCFNKLSI